MPHSADYGQPGGAVRLRSFKVEGEKIRIGSRVLGSVLRLNHARDQAAAREQLAEPESAEDWAKRWRLPWPLEETIRGCHIGDAVRLIQQKLLALGYELPRYGADGDFGGETTVAVRAFQRDRGIPNTGTVDRFTWHALMSATEPGGMPAVTEKSS